MIKYFKTLIILITGLFLFSCDTDLQEPELVVVETDYKESALIVNGISGIGDEGITVFSSANGSKLNEAPINYGKTSKSYIDVSKGETTFSVKLGNTDLNVTAKLNVEAGKLYTLYLCGTKDSPELIIKEDILDFKSVDLKHKMQIANLSPEITEGLEMQVFIGRYSSEGIPDGFYTALGPYGGLTNYTPLNDLPQNLKYKEIVTSKAIPSNELLLEFPYRFIEAGTNTATPGGPAEGTFFVGQKIEDLFQGKFTHTTLFKSDSQITMIVAGTSVNNDQITFNYNNTALYNNK